MEKKPEMRIEKQSKSNESFKEGRDEVIPIIMSCMP